MMAWQEGYLRDKKAFNKLSPYGQLSVLLYERAQLQRENARLKEQSKAAAYAVIKKTCVVAGITAKELRRLAKEV